MSTLFDPLAPFRAPGAKPLPMPERPKLGYRAFGTASGATKPVRLEIRPRDGLAVARLYSGITEIAYDRENFAGILLVLPGKLIKMRGKRLRPLVESLLAGTCEWIAELREGQTHDESIAVIERIEIVTPDHSSPPGPTGSTR